jgi:hypothetical protein
LLTQLNCQTELAMDMPEIHPTYEGSPTKPRDALSSIPPSDREALARKFQAIDGCRDGEAEMQIDALITEFQVLAEPRHPMHLRR